MREVWGDAGPAVLLLPGGAEAIEGFYPGLIEGLMADPGCRIILYDRPGMVGSDIEGGLGGATAAIHETLAEVGLGPVVVIGQSLGGAVGLLLARDHPDDVAGLVLLDPTPVNDVKLAERVEKTAAATARLAKIPPIARMLSAMLRSSAERSARRHHMSPEARAATLMIAQVDLPKLAASAEGLGEIAHAFDESQLPRVPAAVLTADRKPRSAIRRAHQRLATALDTPLLCFPDAEHQVHLTHPEEVLAASRAVIRTATVT